jgi:hypothetical protein
VIEAPAVLVLAWLLGDRGGAAPPGGRRNGGGKANVEPIPDIGAWSRAVKTGGEVPLKQTGGKDPIAWRKQIYEAAKDFLANDDRSINSMTHLVETHAVQEETFDVNMIALAVVAHWDIETAMGVHEYNFNVGGIPALPGSQYFIAIDAETKKKAAFCAYSSELDGIADYFGVLSYKRYAAALTALLMMPTDPGWFYELGMAGYYGMDPTQAEKAWSDRRAAIAVDVGITL